MTDRPKRHKKALRPRARILRTFGDELISSPSVAVSELVKNAYDADATVVMVGFRPPLHDAEGAIDVIDDGHGMSLETIEQTWMEPATLHRRQNTRSEGLRRRVLGEKGIGRFATSRLADELEVVTRRQGENEETHVQFDWTAFDEEERYLDDVTATYWQTEPEEFRRGGASDVLWEHSRRKGRRQGTLLRMTRLRQVWGAVELRELRVRLARLISPFEEQAAKNGFRIILDLPPPFEDLAGDVEPPELLERPQYSLKGSIAKDGSYMFSINLRETKSTEKIEGTFRLSDDRAPSVGPFDIEFRVWDRDPPAMRALAAEAHASVSRVREDLNEAAGVNIYRDGFRVLPYGEPRNDWLRLDLRRVQFPTRAVSNNQVVGFVLISADANPELRDQSNREAATHGAATISWRHLLRAITRGRALVRPAPVRRRRAAQRVGPRGGCRARPACRGSARGNRALSPPSNAWPVD